ncbi:MAG: hypothetical protein PHT38_00280 [Halothiobacillus sp.]|jgi:hypothetical protein|nr:hypothetical protein [Halothiobacillus sp.]MDY0146530.1 hypothetical protein [Halothiobacillus sp.]
MARVVYQVTIRVDENSSVAKLANQKGDISLGEIVLLGDMMLAGGATVSESERDAFYPRKGEGIPLVVKMRISDGAKSFVSSSLVNDRLGGVRRIIRITDSLIVAARHFFGESACDEESKSPSNVGGADRGPSGKQARKPGGNKEVVSASF